MLRFFITCFLLLCASSGLASVELALENRSPVVLKEVYRYRGTAYLALDDVLPVLGLSGRWDSVQHTYRIRTPMGYAVISPGSQFLRLGDRFVPLRLPPRFIDGRLRVDETFVIDQLQALMPQSIYYRNLNPVAEQPDLDESPLDRLFGFLMRKKEQVHGSALGGVVIDPGHGGADPGTIAPDGVKEKALVLDVAKLLEKQLKMNLDVPVYLSRDGDYGLTPQQRVEPATRSGVDVLLQLHAQGALSEAPRGITLFVRAQEEFEDGVIPAEEGQSMQLAQALSDVLVKAGFNVVGVIKAPLAPLGRGSLPTVFIELGYLSNPADLALLEAPEGQTRLAEALYRGIKHYADGQKENNR